MLDHPFTGDTTSDERIPVADRKEFTSELAVVAALREHGSSLTPGPTAQERARMRQRVLAGATTTAVVLRPIPSPRKRADSRRPPSPGRRAGGVRHRITTVVAAVFCLVVALSGLSLLMSKDALPGDPLYGIKRSIENASLDLTFGEQARGLKDLSLAGDRLAEAQALTERPATASPSAYSQAFRDFDASAAAGSRALTDAGTGADSSALTSLRNWASGAAAQILALQQDLPRPAVARSEQSSALLAGITERVAALRQRLGCTGITSGAQDNLGPLPATQNCSTPRSVSHDATMTPMPSTPPPPANRRVQASLPAPQPPTANPDVRTTAEPPARTRVNAPVEGTGQLGPVPPPVAPPTASVTLPLLPLPIHLGDLGTVLNLPGIHIG